MSNLTKPLISGLATRLWIQKSRPVVPISLEDQKIIVIQGWEIAAAQDFIDKVRKLENLPVPSSTIRPTTPVTSHFTTTDSTTIRPFTRTPTPSDGLLEIESKARDIASNAINKLRDNNEISNYLCTELSQLYTKEQWICIVGQKPFPSVSVAENQNTKSKFEFEFSLGMTDVYIIANIIEFKLF